MAVGVCHSHCALAEMQPVRFQFFIFARLALCSVRSGMATRERDFYNSN